MQTTRKQNKNSATFSVLIAAICTLIALTFFPPVETVFFALNKILIQICLIQQQQRQQ